MIEHACIRAIPKPWGSSDLRPWSEIRDDSAAIGELWFERADVDAADPALLLKLLFTNETLSIQVHPDDGFARSIGLEHGKTEAWYVLSASPGAKIALGLSRPVAPRELRASIENGSISDLVQWHPVSKDDFIYVPAGTIHAIGAGLVIAEIQQRSDATFRLFDFGRQRELQVDHAVAAANVGPAAPQPAPRRLSDARTLLVASPHFVLERIDLAAGSNWELRSARETWVLVLEGRARIGLMSTSIGNAVFLDADHTEINAGPEGMKGLLAYCGTEPSATVLRQLRSQDALPRRRPALVPLASAPGTRH